MNDLVVLLPGIMGSALYRGKAPLWDPTIGGVVNALKTWGRSITGLTLPPGIGDNPPDDGVRAAHPVKDVHVIPGLWTPIRGYTRLIIDLEGRGFTEEAGNLLLVPYDWRTSIRCIVAAVTPRIDAALERWRASSPANADARIVFVAHSMGGLVARHYTTTHRDEVRMILTMGTPSRGSVKALEVLSEGMGPNWGWLRDATRSFANSLPGLHHLLPAYACIDTDGTQKNLAFLDADHPVTDLDPTMAAHGIGFLNDLAAAEAKDPGAAHRLHPLIGWRQNTFATVRLTGGKPTFLRTFGEHSLTGDGTVPLPGAAPKGVPLDSPTLHGFAEQHGNLQANPTVIAELIRLLTNAPPVTPKGEDVVEVGVDLPDLILSGDDLTVEATLPLDSRDALEIVLTHGAKTPGAPRPITRRPQITEGNCSTTFRQVPPGVHTVTVGGTGPGSPVRKVTGTVTVWDPAWNPA